MSISLKIGTPVNALGTYGEAGEKTHAFTSVIEATENGTTGVALRPFACDGEKMHQGTGGLYRGLLSVLCAVSDANATRILDESVTCDCCRAKLGLPMVAKSDAAKRTIANKAAAAKIARETAKNETAATALRASIARTIANIEAATKYNATPDGELIAAQVNDFVKAFGPYSAESIASMLQEPREAEIVARKKADNARTIKQGPKDLAKLEAKLRAL